MLVYGRQTHRMRMQLSIRYMLYSEFSFMVTIRIEFRQIFPHTHTLTHSMALLLHILLKCFRQMKHAFTLFVGLYKFGLKRHSLYVNFDVFCTYDGQQQNLLYNATSFALPSASMKFTAYIFYFCYRDNCDASVVALTLQNIYTNTHVTFSVFIHRKAHTYTSYMLRLPTNAI